MNKYEVRFTGVSELVFRNSLEKYFENLTTLISSNESFNIVCRGIVECLETLTSTNNEAEESKFFELSLRITESMPETIKTNWGGVVIEKISLPRTQKYLVINQGKYLALEKHELKEENMLVEEGTGILLMEGETQGVLDAIYIEKGFKAFFPPGKIHCVVALENMVIFEDSLDHKGMDKDLIFIFEPA